MLFYRSVVSFVLMAFVASLLSPSLSFAQGMNLPVPGTMVMPSNGYTPALIRGITIEPLNPLKFDFIIDTGHSQLEGESLELESTKLIKYFLASLTVPEDELWVNLSPYEKERIASESFGRTEMGRDLLGQDYILKQLTSSLLYPESSLGKEFWKRVHDKARAKFGNVEIPVNTFNKVWIIPEDAVVYEHKNSAFVVKSRLKVMLEQDYMALKQDPKLKAAIEKSQSAQTQDINVLGSQVVREIIIPEIEKEVNEGQNFANLRQIYNSMILAAWFKNTLRESLLGQVYVDKNKVLGVDADDPQAKERIYEQYLEAYTKGVYNYIKEDIDPVTNDVIPRKYFSGGFMGDNLNARVASSTVRGPAPVLESTGTIVSVSTAVVENQRVVLPEAAASLKRNLLSLALGGLMFFSPGTSNAVTDQTAAIYANNQAAYKTNISVEQAREELDRNMTAMLGKFKTERRTATVVAPWVRQIARSAQTFDQFTAEIRKVLAAETDKNK
ncbi:MAG: hypothetical protein IT395_06055, partial [Candidatus Omnitrophica bacterium]|nr:hypothetical protein [Candidatus Omnitrophota bacterium]